MAVLQVIQLSSPLVLEEVNTCLSSLN